MSFSYPDTIAVDTITDSAEIPVSYINSDVSGQASRLGIQMFKYGLNTGVEMTMKVYDSSDTFIADSLTVSVDDFPTTTAYFYGWVYFEFSPRVPMTSATQRRFYIQLSNYSYSASSWMGLVRDWPVKMGYSTSSQIQDCPYALDLISAT